MNCRTPKRRFSASKKKNQNSDTTVAMSAKGGSFSAIFAFPRARNLNTEITETHRERFGGDLSSLGVSRCARCFDCLKGKQGEAEPRTPGSSLALAQRVRLHINFACAIFRKR